MQIFEYPYIIITILIFCFVLLTVIGIYFAMRGLKTVNGKDEKDFINISKMESNFDKSGKLREERCIVYVGTSLENFRSLYSDVQTAKVFSEIKEVLLEAFSYGDISVYGDKNFIALLKCNKDAVKDNIESCISSLNKCLLNNSALNIVDIRFGSYYAVGTQISFDDAVNRAKQAYMLAKNEGIAYAEWDVSGGKALEKKIKIENSIENEIDNNRFFS